MPYASPDELPAQCRWLTERQRRAFVAAFNYAWARGLDEAGCFRVAWSAARKARP